MRSTDSLQGNILSTNEGVAIIGSRIFIQYMAADIIFLTLSDAHYQTAVLKKYFHLYQILKECLFVGEL